MFFMSLPNQFSSSINTGLAPPVGVGATPPIFFSLENKGIYLPGRIGIEALTQRFKAWPLGGIRSRQQIPHVVPTARWGGIAA